MRQKNSTDIKNNFKISLEESLYAQVVRIRPKSLVQKKYTREKPKRRYLFQGQSAISKHWFDLDIELVEEKFSTREPQFYNRLFQTNIEVKSGITYPVFTVPIGNSKEKGEIEYNLQDPLVLYHQNA